ncbi:MAG: ribokinase [Nocardioides sp.]|nr:ribokinase [Nocardioides sp.]
MTVVGSLNVDRVVPVRDLPAPGATVIGVEPSRRGPGGKGANQAAAAASYAVGSVAVAMVGAVGADDGADLCLDDLTRRGVDVTGVRRLAEVATGNATVALDAAGQNLIVVDPGANAALGVDDVRTPAVGDADVVLLQLETPVPVVTAAAEHAAGRVVLNPAPPPAPGDDLSAVLAAADVLVPNRGELAAMVGEPEAATGEQVLAQVRSLPTSADVVVTLGGSGALVVAGGVVTEVPAPRVDAVDTTGAGDCFCGVLTVALAEGASLVDATRLAVAAASVSVQGAGARGRLPSRGEVAQPAG